MPKTKFIDQFEILIQAKSTLISEKLCTFEEACINKFNEAKMKALSGTFETILAETAAHEDQEEKLLESMEKKKCEAKSVIQLIGEKTSFVKEEKNRMTTQHPKLESLVDNLNQMS